MVPTMIPCCLGFLGAPVVAWHCATSIDSTPSFWFPNSQLFETCPRKNNPNHLTRLIETHWIFHFQVAVMKLLEKVWAFPFLENTNSRVNRTSHESHIYFFAFSAWTVLCRAFFGDDNQRKRRSSTHRSTKLELPERQVIWIECTKQKVKEYDFIKSMKFPSMRPPQKKKKTKRATRINTKHNALFRKIN